jgi:DNA-binding MarR family transcriptional regulator
MHMSMPTPEAVHAIRAWYRLQRAAGALSAHIRREVGLTGEQLALLRIVGERETWPLAELRARLTMHPATLGQALGRLSDRGLVALGADPNDGRRRTLEMLDAGRALLARAPQAGPGMLRSRPADPARLTRVAEAFDDAIELFGLEEWAT